ncbi:hypothetical protein [Nocardioides yefusunii]|uniref:ATP-binding cassette domain-containing protein n=1 Tax=Nocardioides yefusunii TaxID=2500546 RepID=A0ABW1QVB7_9ACTN|nr:hypothetical protein [Nocardioides yefusunii]
MTHDGIHVRGLRVWLPGRGHVLGEATSGAGIDVDLGGVTLLVGRSGSGTSLLLDALAGDLPAGAMVSGSVRTPATAGSGHGDIVRIPPDLPDVSVRDLWVGPGRAAPDMELLHALGVSVTDTTRTATLPSALRAALALAATLARPDVALLLGDQVLGRLRPEHRAPALAALRRRAQAGTTVVLAEHLLEDALAAADTVVELVRGQAMSNPAATWTPRTLPLPPQYAAARLLALPRPVWGRAGALADVPAASSAAPRSTGRNVGDVLVRARPEESCLARELEIHHHETIGVVALDRDDARALDVARRVVAIAAGRRVLPHPLTLPDRTQVRALIRVWERRHQLGRRTFDVAALQPLRLQDLVIDPLRCTDQHSSGERAALAWAMGAVVPGPRLLLHPERSLDATSRRALATHLSAGPGTGAPHVVISHDPEFLVRACHRLVLLDGDAEEQVGTPALLAPSLPVPPVLRRHGLRVNRVADLRAPALPTPTPTLTGDLRV